MIYRVLVEPGRVPPGSPLYFSSLTALRKWLDANPGNWRSYDSVECPSDELTTLAANLYATAALLKHQEEADA